MSQTINVAHVNAYKQGVRHLQQQMPSRLRGAVRVETGVKRRMAFDQLDVVAMNTPITRHADTVLTENDHKRRWVETAAAIAADLIDIEDAVRTLNQFANPYAMAFVMAANRWCDDQIITAFDATAVTGENAETTATFDTANYQIAAGGTNLTLAKLREARMKLELAENREDSMNPWYLVCGASQRNALLGDPTLTSIDYNSVKALVDGQIDTFLGFKFIKSERLNVSTSIRECYAWGKESMCLGINQEISTSFDKRPDKNNTLQILTRQDMGATRMDEKGVVQILCDES